MSYEQRAMSKLLFSLARLRPDPNVFRDTADTGFGEIVDLAARNGVAPLIYRNLKGLEGVPPDVAERLKNIYLRSVRDNLHHARETVRILRMLGEAGIEAIPLKGSIASEMLLGDPGLYPAGDIDILVRPADLERAKRLLMAHGYDKGGDTREMDLLRTDYHLILSGETYAVELHWNLVKRYFSIPPEFWWEETGKRSYEGLEITVLSPGRYMLYTIFRLFSHGFRPLKFFLLPAALAESEEMERDWRNLLFYARKFRMERLTFFTLRLMHDLLGSKVPGSVPEREIGGYGFLKRRIISALMNGTARIHIGMALYSLLLDTPLDILRVLLKRVFPEASEIRLRYGLPEKSKKLVIFYFLNPFLFLLRKR